MNKPAQNSNSMVDPFEVSLDKLDEVDWDNVEYDDLTDFLQEPGAVEFLAYLDGFGKTFNEIDADLDVSRSYLNDRRDEALRLDLIYPSQDERNGKIHRVWALSPLGLCIAFQMASFNVRQKHEKLLSARKEFNEAKEELVNWSKDTATMKHEIEDYKNRKENIPKELKLELIQSVEMRERMDK